jgi:hypothetical protein
MNGIALSQYDAPPFAGQKIPLVAGNQRLAMTHHFDAAAASMARTRRSRSVSSIVLMKPSTRRVNASASSAVIPNPVD